MLYNHACGRGVRPPILGGDCYGYLSRNPTGNKANPVSCNHFDCCNVTLYTTTKAALARRLLSKSI